MEFGFYLLLILALVAVAGFMLYARFSASREKALHHPPLNVATEEIELSEPEALEPEASETKNQIVEPDVDEVEIEDPVPDQLPAIRAEAITTEKNDDERKSEYLDELQEAAAGLAMLMRSSASNRTTPVVFAPEEEVAADSDPVPVPVEARETHEVIDEEPEHGSEEEEVVSDPGRKTLAILLGPDVADQFDRIDSELEDLETLVANIESGLSVLLPSEEQGIAAENSGEEELTEAA